MKVSNFRKRSRGREFGLILLTSALAMAGGDLAPAPTPTMENSWFDAVTVNYGQSKDRIDIYRIGLRRDFRSRWFESSVGYLSGYWEGSLNYWNGRGDENFGIALSPVFAYYFHLSETTKPYLEGGIGTSLWSRTTMGPRDLSTHFLFEDRIGTGIRFGQWDLAFRYMHYSNAGMKKPNDGFDIFLASVSFCF